MYQRGNLWQQNRQLFTEDDNFRVVYICFVTYITDLYTIEPCLYIYIYIYICLLYENKTSTFLELEAR